MAISHWAAFARTAAFLSLPVHFYCVRVAVWSAKFFHFPAASFCSSKKLHDLPSGFHVKESRDKGRRAKKKPIVLAKKELKANG